MLENNEIMALLGRFPGGSWHSKEAPWGRLYLYIYNNLALAIRCVLSSDHKATGQQSSALTHLLISDFPDAWSRAFDKYFQHSQPRWPAYHLDETLWKKNPKADKHPNIKNPSFTHRVLAELPKVKYGQTLTYGQMADKIGLRGAARAVGMSCGKNPLLIVVPCHRIIGSKGWGGFSAGLELKKILLRHEGFSF